MIKGIGARDICGDKAAFGLAGVWGKKREHILRLNREGFAAKEKEKVPRTLSAAACR